MSPLGDKTCVEDGIQFIYFKKYLKSSLIYSIMLKKHLNRIKLII